MVLRNEIRCTAPVVEEAAAFGSVPPDNRQLSRQSK
jgi:hypothetical protein